ncbi:MAG: hypothetical protein KA109_09010 [Saprospiraceae bacterium]|jgi:hypothetical protein|nr:hypothetical protein [Saprospiraceae bacterium]MBK7370495.1 hypothetical protein [Saprospiraceae bacterium]MBK7438212.1 hypothetical protein [Saprospiraceae bacterium]MBK7609623.1 hypothetical protein [Saprospiraceae bacterium]MBK8280554.1 hypothetical protein [Saprospiraceae bacterium]
MKNILRLVGFCSIITFMHCKNEPSEAVHTPQLSRFVAANSDPEAIMIADAAIEACGGTEAWNAVKGLKWNFFGRRWLLWDKENQHVRIDNTQNDTKLLLDLKTMKGRVYKDGKEWTEPDTVQKYTNMAYKQWINDMYWLVAPLKIKDEGVRLRYLGEDTTQTGIASDVIELKFDSVGVTPQNMYKLWVGKNSKLVAQWAYYSDATDSVPSMITPFDNYLRYGNVFISGDRGGKRQLTGIKVFEELPKEWFENFDALDFEHL